MTKVDFFIVGQAKSGTSALADFLGQHPDICMSDPKEPGFFASDIIKESDKYHGKKVYMKARTKKEYSKYYESCAIHSVKGDATPIYFYSKVAAKNIRKYNKDAKIIIILRNPVEFIQAMHMQYVNDGSESEADFEKALKIETARKTGKLISKNAIAPSLHYYQERAKYSKQIKRYTKEFPKDQILYLTMEEFKKDNKGTLKKIHEFIGVEKKVDDIEFKQVNPARAPKNMFLHKTLNNVKFKNFIDKTVGRKNYKKIKDKAIKIFMKEQKRKDMPFDLKKQLMKYTQSDVKKTSKITGKDLEKLWGYK